MKAIVAGSRRITDYDFVSRCILRNPHFGQITEIVEGGSGGVDRLAARCAVDMKLSHVRFKADWMKYGMAGGPIRNKAMLQYILASEDPGILIAIPTPDSRGTKDMIEQARAAEIEVFVSPYSDPI